MSLLDLDQNLQRLKILVILNADNEAARVPLRWRIFGRPLSPKSQPHRTHVNTSKCRESPGCVLFHSLMTLNSQFSGRLSCKFVITKRTLLLALSRRLICLDDQVMELWVTSGMSNSIRWVMFRRTLMSLIHSFLLLFASVCGRCRL